MEILPLISFFTGVLSILSPCILPVIPILVAFSLNAKSKREIISFTIGLLSIFLIIIFLTGFFTSLLYQYIFFGILMLVDYSFSFSLKLPKNSNGLVGSFVLGFITSISWAPCYSAYLISLISLLVASNSGFYAVFNIVLYCAGFGLTLFVLSFLISKINLESLISKTRYLPKIFAILIIIGALYLFWESFKVLI